MTDKELLELAAKAAGIKRKYYEYIGEWGMIDDDPDSGWWNPLTDDGDALRLAVKLGLELDPWLYRKITTVLHVGLEENIYEDHGNDPYAATRRAIVRAAAEIGRTL